MRSILTLLCTCVSIYAQHKSVEYYEYNPGQNGQYNFGFRTSDGIERSETGTRGASQEVMGSYSYFAPDGRKFAVYYKAGAGGYQILPAPGSIQSAPTLRAPVSVLEVLRPSASISGTISRILPAPTSIQSTLKAPASVLELLKPPASISRPSASISEIAQASTHSTLKAPASVSELLKAPASISVRSALSGLLPPAFSLPAAPLNSKIFPEVPTSIRQVVREVASEDVRFASKIRGPAYLPPPSVPASKPFGFDRPPDMLLTRKSKPSNIKFKKVPGMSRAFSCSALKDKMANNERRNKNQFNDKGCNLGTIQ